MVRQDTKKTQNNSLLFRRGWGIVFSYLKNYRREVIVLSVLGIVSALANASVPYLVGRFFDSIVQPGDVIELYEYTLPLWIAIILIWFLVQAFANGSDFYIDRTRRELGTRIFASYPARASARLLLLPLSFHKEHRTGDTWDRMHRAGSALGQIIENIIINLSPQVLSVMVGLVFAFYINVYLALALVLGIFVYIGTLIKVVAPIAKIQKKANKEWNKAFGSAYDAVSNFETVKQATAEIFERKRLWKAFINKAFKEWYRVEKIWSNIGFFQRAIVLGTQLVIFIGAGYLITQGELSIGGLIALNGYALMVFGPFASLGYQWEAVQNGLVAIERAQDILDLPGENEKKKRIKPVITGVVAFDNVSFKYKKANQVLENIHFDVKPGEVIAFVGESGVGKSTAISLISGYYTPTSGKVLLDEISTADIDLYHLRKHVAVVPQEVVLFNDTILMNIRYGNPDASEEEAIEAARKAHADTFIKNFKKGYKQLVGERGVKLSSGQKQRIAIARAILRNPTILILDEPTSALDAGTERIISKSFEDLMRGRTTFIIAHRLSTVRRADKILVFARGKIVERGTHDELVQIEGGLYKKLYNLHIGLR